MHGAGAPSPPSEARALRAAIIESVKLFHCSIQSEHLYVLISVRTDGNIFNRAADGFLKVSYIVEGFLRKLLGLAAGADVALEAGNVLVNGLRFGKLNALGADIKIVDFPDNDDSEKIISVV